MMVQESGRRWADGEKCLRLLKIDGKPVHSLMVNTPWTDYAIFEYPFTFGMIMGLPTRIYLTGFMGSGKSTIGPLVANVLGYDFIDLDAAIEARAGKSIPVLFEEEGEAAFRAIEAEVLLETTRQEHLVVSVGGGALTFEVNLQRALWHGTVVYLHVPVDQLVRRLKRGARQRPLLRDAAGRSLTDELLRQQVESMLAGREFFYRRAHHIIEVGNSRVGMTVDKIVRALRAPLL
jgi:shikimate kinase